MAKLIVHGATRGEAIERAQAAVAAFHIAGPKHNLAFHAELLGAAEFRSGDYDTGIVSRLR
jgi:acetyl-CoA carboxylase biotin carboxylase subunit